MRSLVSTAQRGQMHLPFCLTSKFVCLIYSDLRAKFGEVKIYKVRTK